MQIEDMAKIIEAEAGVLDFTGKLATAQCICDNRFNANAFTTPAKTYSDNSMLAAELAVEGGVRWLPDAKILQFRSFSKYGIDGGDVPDFGKIYGSGAMPDNHVYLGKIGTKPWGGFYFGRYVRMKKPFKLLVMAGHGRNLDGSFDPGATGCGYREADLTRELSRLIVNQAKLNGMGCDLAPDRNHYDYFKRGNKYDVTGYNYVLEVHFNASLVKSETGDGVMKGTMFYIDQSETGHSVEDAILRNLYSIGSRQAWDGVVITQRQYTSGLMVQNRIRAQGVSHAVLETCFITDMDDVAWYQAKKQLIATKIVEGIIEGFGLAPEANHRYDYVGKGIATGEALEDMNVRMSPEITGLVAGIVKKGQRVEVLEKLSNGWMKVVWPGAAEGYAYTSNVNGKYYRFL